MRVHDVERKSTPGEECASTPVASPAGQTSYLDGRLAALGSAVTSMKASAETTRRKQSAESWAIFAEAECAYLTGATYTCRAGLNKLLQISKCPVGLVLAARIRMGFVEGLGHPAQAVRQLDSAVALATIADSLTDRIHALIYSALYSMLSGDLTGARNRFERVVEESDAPVPRSYLARMELETS